MDGNDFFDTLLEAVAQKSDPKIDLDKGAKDLYSVYTSFQDAGFTREEAYGLVITILEGALNQ